MVAFARQLDYFSEIFQFDRLHPVITEGDGACCPLENQVMVQNLQTLASRLPRVHQDIFRQQFRSIDTVVLETYPSLMPYLLSMDRAHVLAWGADKQFHLAGIFASFPSDIDSELKRFGIRIGKFVYGDSDIYERNRMFVYQYLMELYGFPIVSERRTSSALFARKLHKMGERFLLRVLGQTDRTLTTYMPFFGPVMCSRDPIVVGRTNPREDLAAVLEGGLERLKKGISIIVFPQHTRSREFNPQMFNSIGVKLAKKAGVPIVPLALKTDAWGQGKKIKELGPVTPGMLSKSPL